MPTLVKSIKVSFNNFNSPMSSLPLGLRLDKKLIAHLPVNKLNNVCNTLGNLCPTYKYTNYSYFLTISMKNNFGTPEDFYQFIKQYFTFVKRNCLCEAVDVSFEYYKDHKKLHAHALIDFHCPNNDYKAYRVQQSRFKQWSAEYFKIKQNITLNKNNFYMYKIIEKHKNPDVTITKSYLIKGRDMMVKLNFKPIIYWVKKFVQCVKLIKISKPKNLVTSKSYKETVVKQLATEIEGDLIKYNSFKKNI